MGFYNGDDGSGYEKFNGVGGRSNKITEIQKATNKLSPEEIREEIEIVQQQYMRDMKNISKVHLKAEKLKTPYSKTKKEPIEYVVKESEETNNIIPLNRRNIENIEEKASGEER